MSRLLPIYGKHAVAELLVAKHKGSSFNIQKLLVTKQTEQDTALVSLIQKNKLQYSVVTKEELDHELGRDTVHQGVCAFIHEEELYTPLAQVLHASKQREEHSLLVMLDKLQDPHNVGAIIRSAVAFGAHGIIIGEHDQVPINGTVIKASSGTAFSIPLIRVGNINQTIASLKDSGFWIYGLTGEGESVLTSTSFDANAVILVGSEGNGIAKKTLEACDFKLSIPMEEHCESLNASNAIAVTLYEWSRQHPKK